MAFLPSFPVMPPNQFPLMPYTGGAMPPPMGVANTFPGLGGGLPSASSASAFGDMSVAGGGIEGLGSVGGLAGAGAGAGEAAAAGGLAWPGVGAFASRAFGVPALAGTLGKFAIDRLPFIPGSANKSGSAKSVLGDAAVGAGLGAGIGSVVPGLGTGIGAGIGAGAGALWGWLGPSGSSGGDKAQSAEDIAQRNYNLLYSRLASTGPTGQLMANQLDSVLRLNMNLAAGKDGKLDPAARGKVFSDMSTNMQQAYVQALQQDTYQKQLTSNLGMFQNAWKQFSAGDPFKSSNDQYLKDELARNQYMQGLAGKLKTSGAQQYAKYMLGNSLDQAYQNERGMEAQQAMLPYQLAMQLIGSPAMQSQSQSSGAKSSSGSTSASAPSAAALMALLGSGGAGSGGAPSATSSATSSSSSPISSDAFAQLLALSGQSQ